MRPLLSLRLGAAILMVSIFAFVPGWAAEPKDYQSLVSVWYQDQFKAHPLTANAVGFHEWDAKIDDVTLNGHKVEQERLHSWLTRFEALDPSTLALADRDDLEVVIAQIHAGLLEEEDIQSWRHNPSVYSNLATEAVFQTIKRDYAPLADRMRFAIARTRQIPGILTTGKSLIQDPPRVFVDVALLNIEGAIDFFKSNVPSAFKSVRDEALQRQLANANAHAIAALERYRGWLKTIQAGAKGSFALGTDNFTRKLRYEEMVDIPTDRLLEIGEAQIKKDQEAFVATAHLIDPTKSADEVEAALQKDHPTADSLVSTARDQLVALRQFIVDRNLTPLPPEIMPKVDATPEFERALIQAEIDPPGAYETHASDAFYYVTPPGLTMSAKEREQYLEGFNIPVLNNISVHEVFPGHFVQLMLMRSLPGLSMVRRLTSANSNVEGWAHYCEQMTLDEGFGNNDLKLRLGEITDALLRDARYIVAIKLHTAGMTVEQATAFFIKEGHQRPPIALVEARRGTSDATYLYYTLGKLEILKLREDWKTKLGPEYAIGDFHKRLIESGTVPIKIIRREMLGSDGPLL